MYGVDDARTVVKELNKGRSGWRVSGEAPALRECHRCGELVILAQALCAKETAITTKNVDRAYAAFSVVVVRPFPAVEVLDWDN